MGEVSRTNSEVEADMNAEDVIKYGHLTVLATIKGLDAEICEVGGVCGVWSVKQIMAHLTSHELVLNDVLNSLLGGTETPQLDAYQRQGMAFNDAAVDQRAGRSYAAVVSEYSAAAATSQALIARVPVAQRRQVGLLAWYGAEYDLEDLIAYSNYAHKREHCAQINVYRDTLK